MAIETIGYVGGRLDGIWARAPYLHNRSVPTLYSHLTNRRPVKFYRGNLDIYARFEIRSEIEYVSFRGGQLHDIWHFVTSFDVDHFGEFALQAFTFAQIKSPIVAMFLAGALLYSSRSGPQFS